MSDHKGARMVLGALPPASHLIADRGYDSTWFRQELEHEASSPAFLHQRAGKSLILTTRLSTASATRSKTCSPSSRTGGVSQPDTIDAPTLSSRQSASQPPSYSGSDQ